MFVYTHCTVKQLLAVQFLNSYIHFRTCDLDMTLGNQATFLQYTIKCDVVIPGRNLTVDFGYW